VTFDLPLAIGGLLVGTVVGLTGMGGGALMTPMLVFFFGVDPLTAISSDIVVSLLMKPVGAFVHLRRGTVNLQLVKWLGIGSVPAAFSGAFLISLVPPDADLDGILRRGLGLALLVATTGLIVRALVQMWAHHLPFGEGVAGVPRRPDVRVRPLPTLLLGAAAGLMVGLTSVGAGSIVVVGLLMLHPALQASALVGTDLVQAIPMVGSAAAGHLLFGDFSFAVAASLLVGAVPGAYVGAHISTRAPGGIIRRVLAVLLLASSMKLLGFSNEATLLVAGGALVFGSLLWVAIRRRAKASRQRAVAAARGRGSGARKRTAAVADPSPSEGDAAEHGRPEPVPVVIDEGRG
jgi:uncharacterized membrane protein YfcA